MTPLGMQNAGTSSAFLKRGEYIKNEKLLLNLSGIEVFFFRTERIFSKTFLKKSITVFSINLHYLGDTLHK